jgi:hypothetical protein
VKLPLHKLESASARKGGILDLHNLIGMDTF